MSAAIAEAFDLAQRSAVSHKASAKKVVTAITSADEHVQVLNLLLTIYVDNVLLASTSSASVERLLTFIGLCFSLLKEEILGVCLQHVYSRLNSTNKTVRQRVCQIIHALVEAAYDGKIEFSDDLFVEITDCMRLRLKDKIPAVRSTALKALRRLQIPDDAEDIATLAVLSIMKSDAAASVRATAVEVVALCEHTKIELCARIKDIKSEVRIAMIERLIHETDIRQFSSKMRADILRSGLEDREEKVRQVTLRLIFKWLSAAGEEVEKFLNYLNPVENEEAAQLIGVTLLDELIRSDYQKNNSKLKKAVKGPFSKWQEQVSAITPSELLWVSMRADYARSFLPVLPATELCESILPDAMQLCQLLSDAKAMASAGSMSTTAMKKINYTMRQLLNIAALMVHTADICGLKSILDECADFFTNTDLSFEGVVEHALRAFLTLHHATHAEVDANGYQAADGNTKASTSAAHRDILLVVEKLRSPSTAEDEYDDLVSLAEREDKDEVTAEVSGGKDEVQLLRLERALQLTQWALQREVSHFASEGKSSVPKSSSPPTHRDSTGTTSAEGVKCGEDSPACEEEVNSVFTDMLPFIMSSLQQPIAHVRFLAVSCLGLLGLIDSNVSNCHKSILVQVACGGNFEEDFIRGQALQCLVDFAMIHRGEYTDDEDLIRVLLRMQESGEPELMLLAAESTARLLYAGVLNDAALFANLLKFFFLTENIPQDAITSSAGSAQEAVSEEQIAAEQAHAVFMASCARLQQLLSIFFHVFTTPPQLVASGTAASVDAEEVSTKSDAHRRTEAVIAGAIPQLVSDITAEIKDETLDVTAMSKILKHLLGLCERAVSEQQQRLPNQNELSLLEHAHAMTAAALSRELLKLSSSPLDKAIDKDYVKILASLVPVSWVSKVGAATVCRVADTLLLSARRDKTSTKHLEKLLTDCQTAQQASENFTEQTEMGSDFMSMAPGLTDLIELAARSSVFDQSMDTTDDASVRSASQSRVSQSPLKVFSARKLSLSARKAAVASARRTPQSRAKKQKNPQQNQRSRYCEDSDEDEDIEGSDDEDCIASLDEESEEDETAASNGDDTESTDGDYFFEDPADRIAASATALRVPEGVLSPVMNRQQSSSNSGSSTNKATISEEKLPAPRRAPARASKSNAVNKIALQLCSPDNADSPDTHTSVATDDVVMPRKRSNKIQRARDENSAPN